MTRQYKNDSRKRLANLQIAAFLSLDVQVQKEGRAMLYTFPLLTLTGWLLSLWRLRVAAGRWQRVLAEEAAVWQEWLRVWLTLGQIGLNSARFGLE